MAGENNNWQGGTTAVAQVETFTLNDDFNNAETALTMTMTAEDGTTTQTCSIDPDGVDESAIASAWQTALAASTETMFTKVTWTVASNVVTGTAKTAGVPFYAASSVTGGAGTVTDNESTSSAGPEDWNTAANWSLASVPDDDNIRIAPHPTTDVSWDIKYGLNQSSAGTMASLRVSPAYTGSIGDTQNSYYLHIDGGKVRYNGRGPAFWFKHAGATETIYIVGTSDTADAVHIDGDVSGAVYILGSAVTGTVTIASTASLGPVYVTGAPAVRLLVADADDDATLYMDNGYVEWGRQCAASGADLAGEVHQHGGTLIWDTAYASNVAGKLRMWGGKAEYNGSGTGPELHIYGGKLSLSNNIASSVTFAATYTYGGELEQRSGLDNVTWDDGGTSFITQYGGRANVDYGLTITDA